MDSKREPRKRLIVSNAVRVRRRVRDGMPRVFAERTKLIVFLAVNGPFQITKAAALVGLDSLGARKMFMDLVDQRICVRQHHRKRRDVRRFLAALDQRHPAYREIHALALRLDAAFPVPRAAQVDPAEWQVLPTEPMHDPADVDVTRLFHPLGRSEQVLHVAAAGEIARGAISRLLGQHPYTSMKDTPRVERIGMFHVRRDQTRSMISINPEFIAYRELAALLERLLDLYPRYRQLAARYQDLKTRGVPFKTHEKRQSKI